MKNIADTIRKGRVTFYGHFKGIIVDRLAKIFFNILTTTLRRSLNGLRAS